MARPQSVALISAVVAILTGCKETTIDEVPCPPEGTKFTYETFGAAFLNEHCQRCHGVPSRDRQGAPSGYDFGSHDDVLRHKARIFSRAAADNTTMPPGPDDPPSAEREKLAEWLACGAP